MEIFDNLAESLLGMTLESGWKVTEMVQKKPEDTGGCFSVCYLVEKDSKKAFLKTLDLISALHEDDFLDALNSLTSAFIFKRNLLYKCKEKHHSKIVIFQFEALARNFFSKADVSLARALYCYSNILNTKESTITLNEVKELSEKNNIVELKYLLNKMKYITIGDN